MTCETKKPHGPAGPLTFRKIGALLLIAFLISGSVWLAMRSYQMRIDAEYRELISLLSSEELGPEDIERFQEVRRQYMDIHSANQTGFSGWLRNQGVTVTLVSGIALLISGIGLFLWTMTLLGRGIVWLVSRTK